MKPSPRLEFREPSETRRLIGGMCKSRKGFSRAVLIARVLRPSDEIRMVEIKCVLRTERFLPCAYYVLSINYELRIYVNYELVWDTDFAK